MSSAHEKSLIQRILDSFFPPNIDFFKLIEAQAETLVQAMDCFETYMRTHDSKHGDRVLDLEHAADDLKHDSLDQLNRAFATPIDREDILKAITSLDEILGYAKTTVREMNLLGVTPDEAMLRMAELLASGARELQIGYSKLSRQPAEAEPHAQQAHKTERRIEDEYRHAVARLLDERRILIDPGTDCHESLAQSLSRLVETLRYRELYRHLSNAGDRMETAAEILHNVIVKMI